MQNIERKLTKENIDLLLHTYIDEVEKIGASIEGKKGQALLENLKRAKVNAGPYPEVTLFEAANRIMTDLVIYHGVKWLLENNVFPFFEYTVELGNEDNIGFDLIAANGKEKLVGEAFNVAPSFFQGKKSAMLKKLRNDGADANYKIIMVNHDAVPENYEPKNEVSVFYIIVNVWKSKAIVVPNVTLQRNAFSRR
jgi:hypothetical protein